VQVLQHIKVEVKTHMKQKKWSYLLWLLTPLILTALLLQAGPTAGAAGTGASWKLVPTPNVATMNNALNGVSALSSRDAWAVGYSWNNITGTSQTLTERWNGTTWRIVHSPNPSLSGNRLNAVTALSASNVWAVGSTILHWNGTAWSIFTNPDPNASLFAIAAFSARDIWAVGVGSNGTLTEHWNGTAWSVVPSPTPTGFMDTLWGVTVVSATDAWAVGDYFVSLDPPHNLTLILHWNGTTWKVVPSPSPTSAFNVLHSVAAVSAKDVWAVGNKSSSSNPNIDRTMVQHWNGTKWSVVASPNRSAFNNALLSVTVVSANNIWAVGVYNKGTPSDLTLTEKWNGTKWVAVSSPNGGTDVNTLQSVARVPGTQKVWAVGDYFDTSINSWKTLAEYYS
jgi:hypothetical protein